MLVLVFDVIVHCTITSKTKINNVQPPKHTFEIGIFFTFQLIVCCTRKARQYVDTIQWVKLLNDFKRCRLKKFQKRETTLLFCTFFRISKDTSLLLGNDVNIFMFPEHFEDFFEGKKV